MPRVKTIKAKEADAPQIGKLSYQVALVHYRGIEGEFKKPDIKSQTDYILSCIKDKNLHVLKAEIEDKIVGYIVYRFNILPDKYFRFHKRAFIDSICVDEDYRRRGIGTTLINAVEDDARKNDVSIVEIDCYTFNEPAEGLYNYLGYTDIKHYKRKFIR